MNNKLRKNKSAASLPPGIWESPAGRLFLVTKSIAPQERAVTKELAAELVRTGWKYLTKNREKIMSDPTPIGDILPEIMKDLEEKCVAGGFASIEELTPAQIRQELQVTRLRLVGKLAEVKSLRDSVDEVCKLNAKLLNENARLTHFDGYRSINMPDLPLTLQDLENRLNGEQYALLFEHATCLACLQGNAFDQSIEQYCLEAYVNLWQNSHVGGTDVFPNLYPVTAAEYYREKETAKHE